MQSRVIFLQASLLTDLTPIASRQPEGFHLAIGCNFLKISGHHRGGQRVPHIYAHLHHPTSIFILITSFDRDAMRPPGMAGSVWTNEISRLERRCGGCPG